MIVGLSSTLAWSTAKTQTVKKLGLVYLQEYTLLFVEYHLHIITTTYLEYS